MSEGSELLELQEADYKLLRQRKQLEELPERAQLAEIEAKRVEVQKKSEQVIRMRAESEQETDRLQNEGSELRAKMAEVQQLIAQSSDYREVAALSKEIEGLAKRAEKADYEYLKTGERCEQICDVQAQAEQALSALSKRHDELLTQLEEQKKLLLDQARGIKDKRDELVKNISRELLERYDRAVAAKNGVGAAYLEGDHCSGCRVQLTDGQLAKLRKESEIATCPYCHRLLVMLDIGKR